MGDKQRVLTWLGLISRKQGNEERIERELYIELNMNIQPTGKGRRNVGWFLVYLCHF